RFGGRRPRVGDVLGGEDQAFADCRGVAPERIEGWILSVPVFEAREGGLVDAAAGRQVGQGQAGRFARRLEMLEQRLRGEVDDIETEARRRAAGDQFLRARVPVSKGVPDSPMLSPLLRRPVDNFALLIVHDFFLRRLDLAGGGASKAVTTYTCGSSSSTISKVTARYLPGDVQPNTVGRPLLRLATAAS